MQRHVHARHLANFAAPHARTIHDEIGLDIALSGGHTRRATLGLRDARDLDALNDLGPAIARALGQRQCDIRRVALSIQRQVNPARDALKIQVLIAFPDFLDRDFLNLDPERASHRRLTAQFFQPLIGQRSGNRADPLKARRDAGFLFQRAVKLLAVFRQPRHVLRCSQLRDQSGGVPCRAAGQLLTLQQHNIGPA